MPCSGGHEDVFKPLSPVMSSWSPLGIVRACWTLLGVARATQDKHHAQGDRLPGFERFPGFFGVVERQIIGGATPGAERLETSSTLAQLLPRCSVASLSGVPLRVHLRDDGVIRAGRRGTQHPAGDTRLHEVTHVSPSFPPGPRVGWL